MNSSPSNPLLLHMPFYRPFLISKMSYDMHALYDTNPTQRQQHLLLFLLFLGSCAYLNTFQVCLCSEPELPPTLTSYYAAKYMYCSPSPIKIQVVYRNPYPCLSENGIISYFPPCYSHSCNLLQHTYVACSNLPHVFQQSALSLTTPI